jgi:hypothetical protein
MVTRRDEKTSAAPLDAAEYAAAIDFYCTFV